MDFPKGLYSKVAIASFIVIAVVAFGSLLVTPLQQSTAGYLCSQYGWDCAQISQQSTSQSFSASTSNSVIVGGGTTALSEVGVADRFGGAVTSNSKVDIFQGPQVFDPVVGSYSYGGQNVIGGLVETVTTSSAIVAGTHGITQGYEYYLHAYATSTVYQDEWFRIRTLENGAPIYRLDLRADGSGTYDEVPAGTVQYITGTVNYWNLGALGVYKQPASSAVKYAIETSSFGNAVTGAGNSARSSTPDSAAVDTGFSTIGKVSSYTVNLVVSDATAKTAYLRPMLVVSPQQSDGSYKFVALYGMAAISFNITGIGDTPLLNAGWSAIQTSNTPGYMSYWKIIPGLVVPESGTPNSIAFSATFDTTGLTTSEGFNMRLWVSDLQNPTRAGSGQSTGAPAAYGGVSGYGPAATIFATFFKVSSAKPTGQADDVILTV